MPAPVKSSYADDAVTVQLRVDVPRALKLALGGLADAHEVRLADEVRRALTDHVRSQHVTARATLALVEHLGGTEDDR